MLLFYNWSPYNFAYNNPIRYNDPNGDCAVCKDLWNSVSGWLNKPISQTAQNMGQGMMQSVTGTDTRPKTRGEFILATMAGAGRAYAPRAGNTRMVMPTRSNVRPTTAPSKPTPTAKPTPVGADGSPQTMPETIFRGGTRGNIKHVTPREKDHGMVSFRDSQSNPLDPQLSPQQNKTNAVLRSGENFVEVKTSMLPEGSVMLDGGLNGQAAGHVSVTASPQEILAATVGGIKYPKQ